MGGIEIDEIRILLAKSLQFIAQRRGERRATRRAVHGFCVLAIQLIDSGLQRRVLLLQVGDQPLEIAAVLVEQSELILVRISLARADEASDCDLESCSARPSRSSLRALYFSWETQPVRAKPRTTVPMICAILAIHVPPCE